MKSAALSLESVLSAMMCLCSPIHHDVANDIYGSLADKVHMEYPQESIALVKPNEITDMRNRLKELETTMQKMEKNEDLNKRLDELEKTCKNTQFNDEINTRFKDLERSLRDIKQNNNLNARIDQLASTLGNSQSTDAAMKRFDEMALTLKAMQDNMQRALNNKISGTVVVPSPDEDGVDECPTNKKNSEIKMRVLNSAKVFCEEVQGKQWIVVEYHQSGKQNFNQPWFKYREGIGSLDDEYFIGLENLHLLTKSKPHELLVQIELANRMIYGHYDNFLIGSDIESYELQALGNYTGDAYNFNDGDTDGDTTDLNTINDADCEDEYGANYNKSFILSKLLNGAKFPLKSIKLMIRPKA